MTSLIITENTSLSEAIKIYKKRIDNATFSIDALNDIYDYDTANAWKTKRIEYKKILSWLENLEKKGE